jgi:hypothetical protein
MYKIYYVYHRIYMGVSKFHFQMDDNTTNTTYIKGNGSL